MAKCLSDRIKDAQTKNKEIKKENEALKQQLCDLQSQLSVQADAILDNYTQEQLNSEAALDNYEISQENASAILELFETMAI